MECREEEEIFNVLSCRMLSDWKYEWKVDIHKAGQEQRDGFHVNACICLCQEIAVSDYECPKT